jgi:hypothetical protein
MLHVAWHYILRLVLEKITGQKFGPDSFMIDLKTRRIQDLISTKTFGWAVSLSLLGIHRPGGGRSPEGCRH